MSKTVHSIKLQAYDSVDLNRLTYSNGDLVYDNTVGTLRIMDGVHQGGKQLLRADLSNLSATASLTLNSVTASQFTGNLTGNVTGNLTGNVTGNLTGNVTGNLTGNVTGNVSGTSTSTTGNAATATKLATARNINGVAFDGTQDINFQSPMMLTGSDASMGSSMNLTFASTNGVTISINPTTNNIVVNTPQDLQTTANPSFKSVTVGGVNIKSFAIAMSAALS